jgi:hypothetical protein
MATLQTGSWPAEVWEDVTVTLPVVLYMAQSSRQMCASLHTTSGGPLRVPAALVASLGSAVTASTSVSGALTVCGSASDAALLLLALVYEPLDNFNGLDGVAVEVTATGAPPCTRLFRSYYLPLSAHTIGFREAHAHLSDGAVPAECTACQ